MITQEYLKQVLHYDKDTGVFTWKVKKRGSKGIFNKAGSKDHKGYIQICIDGKKYAAHRLAWIYINGSLGYESLDHIDGVKDNNKINNLRLANVSENGQNIRNPKKNSKSGFLGVYFNKRAKKYHAQITINGKLIYLGLHETADRAHDAYVDAKRKIHPFCTI